jgi:DNA-binding transcriptional MerR regulator
MELKEKYLTTSEAAQVADVSSVTIRTWCSTYGIGRRVGGRYRIDPQKLEKLLSGDVYDETRKKQ